METNAVGPGVVVETNLGRHKESPSVLIGQKDVVVVTELRVAHTKFHSYVGLEIGFLETVAGKQSEWQGEHLVLLVAVHRQGFVYGDGSAREIFVVGVETQETANCNLGSDIVSTFEIHTPTAGGARKIVAQWDVELPVDIIIGIQRYLCLAGRRHRCCGSKKYRAYNIP